MYIDFHTHILPDIDDGSKSVEMSVEMLNLSKMCGAKTVILTPHVNASSDFDEFLSVRNERYAQLTSAVEGKDVPELLCGAEVLLDGSLSEKENVRSLCIEGTELLLLELPYTQWNGWYNREIYNIMKNHGVTPVMAHIERYLKNAKDVQKIENLASIGAKFQVNADSFLTFSGRRIIRELAANGLISAIGSDAHNVSFRTPDIKKALGAFSKKFGPEFIDFMYEKTESLLKNYSSK
jgi:protein-tyrosine phosphatase